MKKSVLLVTLALISPIAYSAGEVEEGPPGIGCAGCANNQSMWDEYNRQQMNSAAAYAEAQRAMQAQIEAQVAADRKRAQEADQARQKQEERQRCMQNATNNKESCIKNSDRNLQSYNGTCHWMAAGGAASAVVGAIVAVPSFGWGAAAGAAGAASFGAAATICYVNAQGAYNQQVNTCNSSYDNQVLNSCGRI
jgi:regulator of protease activity HflC (stomatin/prohibitin superfamily)